MRKFTEEHKRKISKAKKGKPHSEEHCINISMALKGKKFTEEHKKRISKALLGNCNAVTHGRCQGRIQIGWNYKDYMRGYKSEDKQ